MSLGDTLAGLHAAFGVVMALLHRQRHNNTVPGQVLVKYPNQKCAEHHAQYLLLHCESDQHDEVSIKQRGKIATLSPLSASQCRNNAKNMALHHVLHK